MGVQSNYIWMDGTLVPFAEAKIHFLTPALHYGAAVFEGIRCYATDKGPAIFRAREHAERLIASARILGFRDIPWDAATLVDAFRQTVDANGFSSCYIRPLAYLAEGGWNLNADGGRLSLGIAAWEWPEFLGEEALSKGIRANVSSFTRHHPNVSMTKAKISGNYVSSMLAKTESQRLGFDEAIMLDPQGYVAECSGENLFAVRNKIFFTTPSAAILEGITRDTVATLIRERGYEIRELPISRDQLYSADEVFVCGSAAEVVGLREIDFRKIGAGNCGPLTKSIQEAYAAELRGQGTHAAEWLCYVSAQENNPGKG